MKTKIFTGTTIALLSSSMLSAIPAMAASITNGGFEAGFTGWTTVVQPNSNGNLSITGGGTSPISGARIPSPSEGTKYAVTDQFGPGSYVLYQDISLESGANALLSFDWFAQGYAPLSTTPSPAGSTDFTVAPNEFFRVDVVSAGFNSWFGSSTAGVLATILNPVNQGNPVNGWTKTTYNLSAFNGQTIRLAFREVDNQGNFQAGVDNVSINSRPVPVPAILPGMVLAGLYIGKRVLNRKSALSSTKVSS
ncbi:hypothetical protein [Pseudanabaena sp. Chao 1811]|uniref:hypothetical protein n=1 Tax=Pseudanabaena sp. Chao 1811 TaxID=2963092 RepID=UPI0022F3BD14|nr:hypothetical protein [Pseudanabaena sp. Chao 1811]